MLTVLSMGWGVQSFTLACMSALGHLPKLDFAVFADTMHEKSATYAFMSKWQPWLEEHGIWVAHVDSEEENRIVNQYGFIDIPAFATDADNLEHQWVMKRQCTSEWKIWPTRRFLQEQRVDQPVELWMGISTDEFERAKDSNVKYIRHRFPLLELDLSREDCQEWLIAHDLEVPPRSSCYFCPYTYLDDWKSLEKDGPEDFAKAVDVDEQLRNVHSDMKIYLNRFHVPLAEIGAVEFVPKYALEHECDSGFCFS